MIDAAVDERSPIGLHRLHLGGEQALRADHQDDDRPASRVSTLAIEPVRKNSSDRLRLRDAERRDDRAEQALRRRRRPRRGTCRRCTADPPVGPVEPIVVNAAPAMPAMPQPSANVRRSIALRVDAGRAAHRAVLHRRRAPAGPSATGRAAARRPPVMSSGRPITNRPLIGMSIAVATAAHEPISHSGRVDADLAARRTSSETPAA